LGLALGKAIADNAPKSEQRTRLLRAASVAMTQETQDTMDAIDATDASAVRHW